MIGSAIGSYRIVRLLGSGGTGSVYEGAHQTSRRSVAIKVLNAASAESPAAVARFLNGMREKNHRRKITVSHDLGNDLGKLFPTSYSVVQRLSARQPLAELNKLIG